MLGEDPPVSTPVRNCDLHFSTQSTMESTRACSEKIRFRLFLIAILSMSLATISSMSAASLCAFSPSKNTELQSHSTTAELK